MKVLQINSVYPIKSTGRIVMELADIQKENGIEPYMVCSECTVSAPNVYVMGSNLYNKANILMTRLFGKHGFYNRSATKKMLKWVDKVKPDIIHLHNLHGHYINIRLLFEYIKSRNIPVVWTLHDCWAFTGHCAHFDYVGCRKWKTGCGHCQMQKSYPVSWFFDRSKGNFRDKKKLFTSVDNMHIVTPSKWLADLCKESYLGKYPVNVIYNGIDTGVFLPTPSDLKKRLGIKDKFVIMGVINKFAGPKGGEYFLKLSKMLRDDEVIVLMTLDEKPNDIPSNILSLPRVSDDRQLVEFYSMADVFVNPTLQETFGMVNLEAIACGVPVVTFNTGGATESQDLRCGFSVKKGDVKGLYEGIKKVRSGAINPQDCRERALKFKSESHYPKYLDIYKRVLEN